MLFAIRPFANIEPIPEVRLVISAERPTTSKRFCLESSMGVNDGQRPDCALQKIHKYLDAGGSAIGADM
jgi:hypothetical protein